MFERLKSWLLFRRARTAKGDAARWLKEASRLSSALERKQGELRSVRRLFNDTYDEAEQMTEQARSLIDKYEPTMEALRQKAEVLENVLMPELVAAHRLALERMNADAALEIRRRVGHEINEKG